MGYSYYPGCTLKNKAKDLDYYARSAAQALGIELNELAEWQCCSTVYPLAQDELGNRLSAVRALDNAKQQGDELITLCSACHHVIKRVNNDMATKDTIRENINNYMELEEPYAGETTVLHYIEMLRDRIGFDALAKQVKNPMKGQKIAAYYGCLLLRPSSELQFDNPENPSIMEDFISALGADAVIYPYRNECCGGYLAVEDQSIPQRMCGEIFASAKENGATAIITACPLCYYNLEKNSKGTGVEVIYFTKILAEALGLVEGSEAV
ncbi:CoB--CoM heterodisulfide reductase iron-sulfur subunit B family protein [Clostridia bacterium OttesenSCG-928-F22]|nr:CoB--CoM heterodisulfide reductase iron-sulfur subunit B family protein [Clostridia bacterium OttesenSCG-928-F22]